MRYSHNSPAPTDQLADEVKATVVIAVFGLVALGFVDGLAPRDEAWIAPDAAARASNQETAPSYSPGELRLNATTAIDPHAPTF